MQPDVVRLLHLTAAAITAAALVAAALGGASVPRALVILSWLITVPGWVVVALLPVRLDGTSRVALAVALSLAVTTSLASLSLWLEFWHPRALLYAAAAACFVGLATALARRQPA